MHQKVNVPKAKGRIVWDWNSSDWPGFRDEVDKNLQKKEVSEKILRDTINAAAKEKIGTKKIGRQKQIWMTKEIRHKIEETNTAKKNRHNNAEDYHQLCKGIDSLIREKKL